MGALTTTLIGSAYAFSVFIAPLEAEFSWPRPTTTLAFSVAMLLFGFFTFVGGVAIDRFGPRATFCAGASLMAASQMLASKISSIEGLVLTYGVLLGTGIGLAYAAVTTALASRWYPDAENRGVAIGVSLMGMGLGSALAAPVWTKCIEAWGWRATYFGTGATCVVVLGVLATLIRFPPKGMVFARGTGWHFPGDSSAAPGTPQSPAQKAAAPSFNLMQAFGTYQLWLMALLFFLTMFGGLMVVSQLAAWGIEKEPAGPGLAKGTAALLVSLLAVCNGIGRPTWGWISGRIGIRTSLVICPVVMAAALMVLSQSRSFGVALTGALLTGVAYGGTLALIPTMTAALFGAGFVGRIYGFIYFLGFGVGGYAGIQAGARTRDQFDQLTYGFWAAAALALVSAILAFFLLPARGQERLRHPSEAGA